MSRQHGAGPTIPINSFETGCGAGKNFLLAPIGVSAIFCYLLRPHTAFILTLPGPTCGYLQPHTFIFGPKYLKISLELAAVCAIFCSWLRPHITFILTLPGPTCGYLQPKTFTSGPIYLQVFTCTNWCVHHLFVTGSVLTLLSP